MLRLKERTMLANSDSYSARIDYYKEWFRYCKPKNRYNQIHTEERYVKKLGLTFEAFGVKIFCIHKMIGDNKKYSLTHVPTGLGFPLRLNNRGQSIRYLGCIIAGVPMDWFNVTHENQEAMCKETQEHYSKAHSNFMKGTL